MRSKEKLDGQNFEQATLVALGNVSGGMVSQSGSPLDFFLSFVVVRLSLLIFYRLPTTPLNEINLFFLAFIFWAIGRSLTYNNDWYNPLGSRVSTQTNAEVSLGTAKNMFVDMCGAIIGKLI